MTEANMFAKRLLCLCAGLLCLVSRASSQPIDVMYDASILPTDDPIAPWQVVISGNSTQAVQSGILHLADNSATDSYVAYLRDEPAFTSHSILHVEARVGFVSNNGWFSEPSFAIGPQLGTQYYPMSFYSDRIELRRHYTDGTSFVLASVPVPDLGTAFHVIRLDRYEGVQRHFEVFLDGTLVAVTADEPPTPALDAISFGHGLYVGSGTSRWDYLHYWTDAPVSASEESWGALKTRYRATPGAAQPAGQDK